MSEKSKPKTGGEIREGEYHPMADSAMTWFKKIPMQKLLVAREAMASTAIEGNRVGQICGETLDRMFAGMPVSDRYLLGLCWLLRDMNENDQI